MSQIVLDALSHQAIRHAGTEQSAYGAPEAKAGLWREVRLSGAIAALARSGHSLAIARPEGPALADAALLVIASRSQLFPFTPGEVAAIRSFVDRGGGLWLMANHRLFVAPQQRLAEAFGLPLRLNDITVADWPGLRIRQHPITEGVGQLRVRNASSISTTSPDSVIAAFADDERHTFAAAIDPDGERTGRVLVTSDSGFIASRDDAGHSMFESADNARFFANAVSWLTGDR